MKRQIINITILVILISAFVTSVHAERLVLTPVKVATMTSPTESRDERVLIYFELPKKLDISCTEIDFAKLVFSAQVTEAAMGQIEVYPMTSSWKDLSSLDWEKTWTKEGGDYSKDHEGKHLAVRSADGKKSLRSNVTYVVMAWLDGTIDNHGFILVPSQDDLSNSDVIYSIDTKGIQLVINYSLD